MTIQTRETLRAVGYYVPWVAVFLLVGYQSWTQSAHNLRADTERGQRITYTDSIEKLDGARVITDAKGRIREWSAGMSDIFGYSSDEALGRNVEFLLPVEMRDRHRHWVEEAMRSPEFGRVREIDCPTAITKSGREIAIKVRVRIESRQGEPVAIATFDRAKNVDTVPLVSF